MDWYGLLGPTMLPPPPFVADRLSSFGTPYARNTLSEFCAVRCFCCCEGCESKERGKRRGR